MWCFAFGSLMSDGWEKQFLGHRVEGAPLLGYRREFNKASTRNWGTVRNPGPTLGLAPTEGGAVIGVAFEFGDKRETEVLSYLRAREGASLVPEVRDILLPNIEKPIRAFVFIPKLQGAAYIGALSIAERAAMAKMARRTHGACEDYARSAQRQLRALGIHDSGIEEFVFALDAIR